MRSNIITTDYINDLIADNKDFINTNEISDGYHTFGELYKHRIILYIVLAKQLKDKGYYVWRAKTHSDGSSYDGWFILGIGTDAGDQITYHLSNDYWDMTNFADDRDKAPTYDGHTPDDVLDRIMKYL
jgi:hypothetical protein